MIENSRQNPAGDGEILGCATSSLLRVMPSFGAVIIADSETISWYCYR